MKTVTDTYLSGEYNTQSKPVELYKLWEEKTLVTRYYTNGDVAVDFGGNTYNPISINRRTVSYNAELDVSTLELTVSSINEATVEYIALNPIDITWVEVSLLHRDQSPLEKSIIFLGQIKTVSFKGTDALVNCVGFEYALKMPIPRFRYQLDCNYSIFDSDCQKLSGEYRLTTEVLLDSTETVLLSSDFGLQSGEYYTGGHVVFSGENRSIVAHQGNTATIFYAFSQDISGEAVDVYPGCNGRPETCRDKFNNINRYFGFPWIPTEDPTQRL